MLPSLTQEIHAIYVIIMVYTLYDDSNAKKFEFIELIHLYNSPIDNKLETKVYRTLGCNDASTKTKNRCVSTYPPASDEGEGSTVLQQEGQLNNNMVRAPILGQGATINNLAAPPPKAGN